MTGSLDLVGTVLIVGGVLLLSWWARHRYQSSKYWPVVKWSVLVVVLVLMAIILWNTIAAYRAI